MSMSAVWADILSHKDCVWRQMPPQPPPVHLPNIQTLPDISSFVLHDLDKDTSKFKKDGESFSLSTLEVKEETRLK